MACDDDDDDCHDDDQEMTTMMTSRRIVIGAIMCDDRKITIAAEKKNLRCYHRHCRCHW